MWSGMNNCIFVVITRLGKDSTRLREGSPKSKHRTGWPFLDTSLGAV
jgi:hypothetical protein